MSRLVILLLLSAAAISFTTDASAGSALQFDGISQHARSTLPASVRQLQELTLGVWVRWDGYGNGGKAAVLEPPGGVRMGGGLGLGLGGDASGANGQALAGCAYGGLCWLGTGSTKMPAATWHHLAVVVDATSIRTYQDGVLGQTIDKLRSLVLSGTPTDCPTNGQLYLGGWFGIAQTATSPCLDAENSFLQGAVDEVCIWSRALSDHELQIAMRAGGSAVADGLVAYFDFEEGSGPEAHDRAGTFEPMTLKNEPQWVPSPVPPDATVGTWPGSWGKLKLLYR